MRWLRKRATTVTPVEVHRASGRSELWRYSDDSLRCRCGYACLATFEQCEFDEIVKWPGWPNGCPE